MTEFSERLMAAARYAGVREKQSAIAADLGVTPQVVSHWFRKGEPDSENLERIEKRWGVNRLWLRTGEGQMLEQPSPDGLSPDERDLVRNYRLAPANVRKVILSTARAARKAIVMVPIILPGFMPDTGAFDIIGIAGPIARSAYSHITDCLTRLLRRIFPRRSTFAMACQ